MTPKDYEKTLAEGIPSRGEHEALEAADHETLFLLVELPAGEWRKLRERHGVK